MYCAVLDDNKVCKVSVSHHSIHHHVGSSIGSEDSAINIPSLALLATAMRQASGEYILPSASASPAGGSSPFTADLLKLYADPR